jgi:hypothetical protein
MATTTATHYALGHLEEDGGIRDYREMGRGPGVSPASWAVRLHYFWPANRPGASNDPWNLCSSVGRDRGALSFHVAPLLRGEGDQDAAAIRVFDVQTRPSAGGSLPPVLLDTLLPARVRAGDGLLIQADLVDVSLFTTTDEIMTEAGRITDRRPQPASRLSLDVNDTLTLLSEVGGYLLSTLWHGVLHPTGVDARAWNPRDARFQLYGPSLDEAPQARAGRYLLTGSWEPLDLAHLTYDRGCGLRRADDETPMPVFANALEFELLPLREPGTPAG